MSNIQDVRTILTDDRFDRDMRLTRLQGFRGNDADKALKAGFGARIGPAVCGAGGILGVVLASPWVLGFFGVLAAIGAFAPNYPAETLYNVFARRNGTEIPPNPAGRRLGCLLAAVFLAGATIAYVIGATIVGAILGLALGTLALFAAATNICGASIIFTLLRGSDRAQDCALMPALRGTSAE
jgi:uncharacterized protein DUF4395